MEFLLLLGIIAIAGSPLALPADAVDNSGLLKVTKVKLLKADPEYYKGAVILEKVDDGKISIDTEHLKDFPSDTWLEVVLLRSPPGCQQFRQISSYRVSICDNSKNDLAIHLGAELSALKKQNTCFKKGPYKNTDKGYFKFHDLLKPEELTTSCFMLVNSLKSNEVKDYIYNDEYTLEPK